VNLIVTLEPVFTAAIANLLLDERLTWIQVSGAVVILAGVVMLRISEGRAEQKTMRFKMV
jgi:drug/metabolite transporter (DMT)-like permease